MSTVKQIVVVEDVKDVVAVGNAVGKFLEEVKSTSDAHLTAINVGRARTKDGEHFFTVQAQYLVGKVDEVLPPEAFERLEVPANAQPLR